jgi:LysR family transcriptional regulator (chromosome initiation inhibitor)
MILLSPQLDAFIAVAKHKSIHAGARAIHISQTAMTQRIHTLEARLGTTLFVRTRQGVHLTAEGEELLRYCHTVRELSGETLAKINSAGTTSTIRINISGPASMMVSRIIPECLAVMKKFPQLYLGFDVNDSDDCARLLRVGDTQFAILEPAQLAQEMKFKSLAPEKYLLVCSSRWQHRKLKEIISSERIIDFDVADKMTLNYLKHFKLLKHANPERLFVNRTEALARMIAEGYGYGVLTEEFSAPLLARNELMTLNAGKSYAHTLVLAWYDRPQPPGYFCQLIKAMN